MDMATKKSTKTPVKKVAKQTGVRPAPKDSKVSNGANKSVVTTTVADKPKVDLGLPNAEFQDKPFSVPEGTHAEERLALEQGNIQVATNLRSEAGAAIVSVDVPAHTKEVAVAFSQIPGCAVAAVQAWDTVRGNGDAPFASSVLAHQMKLVAHAESIYRGGSPMSGDTALAKFEREVARIKSEQDKEKS
jgi:hypothetical protein